MTTTQQKQIAIATSTHEQYPAAEQLAKQLGLPFIGELDPNKKMAYDYLLLLTPAYLGLLKTSEKRFTPFYIDFLSGKLAYRSKQAGLRKELLARAIGCKPSDKPVIVDATAGLGRDSFILAKLGFNITMLERSPVLYVLLQDALARARSEASLADVLARMHLIHTDAISWLNTPAAHPAPDVILLDPMFPKRQKSASSKKEMALLQDLLGKDEDEQELFATALACATQRVVVKRPQLAPNIAEYTPDYSLPGNSCRFDIYLT